MTELKQNPVRSTKGGTKSGAEPVFERTCLVVIEAKMIDDSAGPGLAGRVSAIPDLVAGLGARRAAAPDEILALLDAALAGSGHGRNHLAALATLRGKDAHPALRAVAAALDIPLLGLPETELRGPVPNPSPHAARHLGLPSIAEAAALAFGPLLVEKRRSANATCALSRWLAPYAMPISSAASAAAISPTSCAGA